MMNRSVSFGAWVRARRRALDLTQDELARRVGCAIITIRKIEADERRPSREMAQRLAEELELSAGERDAFVKAARQDMRVGRLPADAPFPSFTGTSGPPAPTTPLIGRERELEAVRRLLCATDVHLLTLTGMGGAGKTRLALAIAREAVATFPDGVYVVSLAPLTSPTLVLPAIAQVVGIVEMPGHELIERVQAQLGAKRTLLVLDNVEHVIEAAPVVTELLWRCPSLTVLATSRSVLHLSGEHVLPVLPFPVPESLSGESWKSVAKNEAVRLFAERAQAVNPAFSLSETVVPIVAEICGRLDGLPLAIELAAARSTMLAPRDILARLDNALRFLAGGLRDVPARQRTLRATLDWSYGLLQEPEQILLRRLAVFAGTWTLHAAEAVSAIEGDIPVFEMLSSLVDHSLVQWEGESAVTGRFRLLGTVREYALERLEEAGEAESMRRRHATYWLAVAEGADTALRGRGQLERLEQLEREHDNLREALHWCLARNELELSYRFVGALWRFWFLRGHFHEWDRWWAQLSAVAETDAPTPLLAVRAKVLLGRAFLAHYEVDSAQALILAAESLELYGKIQDAWGRAASLVLIGAAQERYGGAATGQLEMGVAQAREVGDPWLLAWSLQTLGDVLGRVRGQRAEATVLLEESLDLARQTSDCWLIARALTGLVQVLTLQYDYRRAATLADESLALYRTLGDRLGMAWSLHDLGVATYCQGDFPAARRCEEERLTIERQLGNLRGVWHALWSLEMVLLELGDVDQAKVLNDESLILARELGEPWRVILSLRDRAVAALLQYDIGQAVDLAREAAMLSSDVEYGWVRASALRALAWAFLMGDGPEKPGMLFREALELERDGGSIRGVAESLEGLAAVASAQGQRDRTAQLDAAASTLRRSIHTPLRPSERLLRAASMRYANAAPGAEMLNPAVGEDEDAHIDAVIAAVLSQNNDRLPPVN